MADSTTTTPYIFILLLPARRLNNLSSLGKAISSDSNQETANHEQIIRINAAYEVLRDAAGRQSYDQNCRLALSCQRGDESNSKEQLQNIALHDKRDGMLMSNEQWLPSLSTSQSFAV